MKQSTITPALSKASPTNQSIIGTVNANNILTDQQRIQADLSLMIQYATRHGIPIPLNIDSSNTQDMSDLIASYNSMIDAIKPANVQAIKYIDNHILNEGKIGKKWHKTPIITNCLIISSVALISLIAISLSPSVNEENMAAGLLASSGKVLFYNLIFICSASLLGVMFYLLKTLSDKIKNYTLLPVDSIEVNTTILIGVISGFIISELFTFNSNSLGDSIQMQKMTLALIGGFSSDAIFSILKGIVNKMKMFLDPNT